MVEWRRRERRARLLLLAIAIGALACCAVVGGLIVLGAVAFSDTDRDDSSREVVENVARMRLPPGARDLRSHLEGFQDRMIWVRFTMPEHELPAFERSLSCRLAAPSSTPPNLPTVSRPAWWSDARISRACHGRGPGFVQTVIVDVSTAPDLLVSVVVFES